MLSSLASPMNPQVLMIAISPLGLAESCTQRYPANSNWRISRSASTRFFEQPNVIISISPFLISISVAV